jgi:hypothetical protein
MNCDDVTNAKLGAGDGFGGSIGTETVRHGFALGLAEGIGLSFAAAFCDGFGEIREKDSEPEPESDLKIEADGLMASGFFKEQRSGDDAADFDDEHDGVLHHDARVELAEGIDDRLAQNVGVPEVLLFGHSE